MVSNRKGVVVIGSAGHDYLFFIDHFPSNGETLHANKLMQALGGKGSNQAAMIGKLSEGDSVKNHLFVCCVGDDKAGKTIVQNYKNFGFINVDQHIRVLSNVDTGLANVMVEESTGNNRIIIVPGANEHLSVEHVEQSWSDIEKNCSIMVSQLETNVQVTLHAFKKAKQQTSSIMTILNPAPARKDLPQELYQFTDIIVPNEEEASLLSGIDVKNIDSAKKAAKILNEKGTKTVIITLGGMGSLLYHNGEYVHIPAEKVEKIIDTTGAGDCFVGSLSYFLSFNVELSEALRLANVCAAQSIQAPGAQVSYPSKEEVKKRCKWFKED